MNQYPQYPQYPQQTPPNFPQGQPGYPQQYGAYPQAGVPPYPGAYPQAGIPPYPGQFQAGYPVQPPRRSRAGVWIAIIAVIVLLGGGVATYFIINQSSPTATLNTLCDGFQKEDAQEMYNTFSTSEQARPGDSVEDLQSNFNLLNDAGVKISSCKVSNVQQNGSTATGTITLTLTAAGDTHSASEDISLVQENGQWKVNGGYAPNTGTGA